MTKRKKITVIAVISVPVVVLAACAFIAALWYIDNRRANFTDEYVLYVRPETAVGQIIDSLGHVAVSSGSLERTFRRNLHDIKPGKYVVKPEFTSIHVARMLSFGWQTPQNMTLSGTIRTKEVIARKISRQMMADSASIVRALCDSSFLSRYGFTPENVFAMILPDTYQMYWTASVEEIFDRLKREYDTFWTPERLAKAEQQKLSPMQVSVMASIVSGETLKSFEYPKIAGAYLNRYHIGMKLQADPTICYCYGYKIDRVLKKHLSIDSPYNTYKYKGLPPSPINVPPKACIDAVLNPDEHKYKYFCASDKFDGTHLFAVTYNEHLKNAHAFHKALTAKRKAQQSGKN